LWRCLVEKFDYWKNRNLESWTSDIRVAEYFAGLRQRQTSKERQLYKIPSLEEVDKAVRQYERTGFLKFGNQYFLRNKENPEYYNIYDRNKDYVTDGNDIRRHIKSNIKWSEEINTERLGKAKVLAEPIDKNKIVWITNNLNSKEYIVRAN
jgi:hypothetical protein